MSLSEPMIFSPAVDVLSVPPWVAERFGTAREQVDAVDGLALRHRKRPAETLVSVTVRRAAELNARDFEQTTVDAYHLIRRTLASTSQHEPVRFWNHIPGIHQQMDAERDRYMVFNAGRFRAFCDWFGGADQFAGRIATASGVGHRGSDLVVHCLAARERGKSVENPRQIPAFRYSKRYGPLPPCFARAMIVPAATGPGRSLLVGGTASIAGERSVHRDLLAHQMRETLANLRSLVTAADDTFAEADALAAFTHVRIYHPRSRDAKAIEKSARAAFSAAEQIELLPADLCRAELLVEIEGVAQLSS
jgi:chorismate lyase/3-hydroxybenzoate synthase